MSRIPDGSLGPIHPPAAPRGVTPPNPIEQKPPVTGELGRHQMTPAAADSSLEVINQQLVGMALDLGGSFSSRDTLRRVTGGQSLIDFVIGSSGGDLSIGDSTVAHGSGSPGQIAPVSGAGIES